MKTPAVAMPLVTLLLMTEKGFLVLQHVVAHLDKSRVALVIGAQDRGLIKDYFLEIKALCMKEGIPFLERKSKQPVRTAYSIAVSWRWIIDDVQSLIVLHDSLLPRYRGFAPLVSCLLNKEPEVGVTALYANSRYDSGPVLAQAKRTVEYPITIATAIELVGECYCELASWLWQALQIGLLPPGIPQVEADATYSLWRDEQDYRIDWHRESSYLRRFIDALGFPYRGASTFVADRLCRVLAAEEVPDVVIENRIPGKVLFVQKGCPVVVCGTGLLRILMLQTEDGDVALPLKHFRTRFM